MIVTETTSRAHFRIGNLREEKGERQTLVALTLRVRKPPPAEREGYAEEEAPSRGA